jgi:hypothetical protein
LFLFLIPQAAHQFCSFVPASTNAAVTGFDGGIQGLTWTIASAACGSVINFELQVTSNGQSVSIPLSQGEYYVTGTTVTVNTTVNVSLPTTHPYQVDAFAVTAAGKGNSVFFRLCMN